MAGASFRACGGLEFLIERESTAVGAFRADKTLSIICVVTCESSPPRSFVAKTDWAIRPTSDLVGRSGFRVSGNETFAAHATEREGGNREGVWRWGRREKRTIPQGGKVADDARAREVGYGASVKRKRVGDYRCAWVSGLFVLKSTADAAAATEFLSPARSLARSSAPFALLLSSS